VRLVGSLEVAEEKVATFEKRRSALDEARQRQRLREVELQHKRDGYRGRLEEECATTPEKLREEGLRAARGSLSTVSQEVSSLKSRLERIGEINTAAITELKDIQKRHDFMVKERDDLLKSKEDLLKIIGEADGEARERFDKTFAKVNGNFRKIFGGFFEGGEADLVLVDVEGHDDKGVEIIARPPKLKKSSVNLLSGGQRAMTAIALLFAIFKVKASPFCILDELDAPLDDDNIVKFLESLDGFLEKSQFIIITHNKLTMEKADVIYGVTMEERGVSKIVSVKLREAVKA
jgi:chromosome segregation protein